MARFKEIRYSVEVRLATQNLIENHTVKEVIDFIKKNGVVGETGRNRKENGWTRRIKS